MRCPVCSTINRDDQERCYHCGSDLTLLRLIVGRAKAHYNRALEHAERDRPHDAIAELDEALLLQDRFPEARLLLGTLYARLERPEDARREWQQVLASDPDGRRAATYLAQLEPLQRSVPLARRAAVALALGVGTCAVAVLVLLLQLWPSPQVTQLDAAYSAYAAGNLARAEALLSSLERPMVRPAREARAAALEATLRRTVEGLLEDATQALARRDYAKTLEALARLTAMHPPSSALHAERQLSEAARTGAEADLLTLARTAELREDGLNALEMEAAEVTRLFPDSTTPEEALAIFARRAGEALDVQLALLEELVRSGSPLTALRQEQHEALALGRAAGRFRETLDFVLRQNSEVAQKAMEQSNAAPDTVAALAALRPLRDVEMEAETAALLAGRMNELLTNAVTQELASGGRERALALGVELRWEALPEDERRGLRQALADARRSLAMEAYRELLRRADAVEQADPSEDEARQIVALMSQARAGLPPLVATSAEDDFLFLEAIAASVLGENAQAAEATANLTARFPRSPYLSALTGRAVGSEPSPNEPSHLPSVSAADRPTS